MARYELSLCKTKMYKLVSDYRTDLPKMCRCKFTHLASNYCMEYFPTNESYYRIRVTVTVCLGHTTIRIKGICPGDIDEELYFDELSFNYLRDNGFLREVA